MDDAMVGQLAAPRKRRTGRFPFAVVGIVFLAPIIAQAYLMIAYQFMCSVPAPGNTSLVLARIDRLLLPFLLATFGYLIFVLEGAQSSVMLANKHSIETLDETLKAIDISGGTRERARRALSSVVGGVPIDGFFIGRQLMMVAFAFLFKLSYDNAGLAPGERDILAQFNDGCAVPPAAILAVYGVLNNWLFSTFICAVLVAYFFQVPSKLMAQHHPMRFFTTIPLTVYAPIISHKLGLWSLLGIPIRALRERATETSYFAGKEHTPVGTHQVFDALAQFYGEYVSAIIVTLCPESPEKQDVWFVKDESIYKIIKPSRDFSQAIQVPEMKDLKYKAGARGVSNGSTRPPFKTSDIRYTITPSSGGTTEILTRVYARFDSDQPPGSEVVWEMSYLTPVLTARDGPGGITRRIFDIHIKKPVAKLIFRVVGVQCEQPKVTVCPVDGAESPTCGRVELEPLSSTTMGVVVHYPSIGSRLEFRF